MNKSDMTLMSLEKKLEAYSPNEVVLNKFLIKPKFDKNEVKKGKDFLKNLDTFVNNFKKSNDELLSNQDMIDRMNIENDVNSKGKCIKMDLGLGVLELNEKSNAVDKDNLLNNIINCKKSDCDMELDNPMGDNDLADQEILNFLIENSLNNKSSEKKTKKRIRSKKN